MSIQNAKALSKKSRRLLLAYLHILHLLEIRQSFRAHWVGYAYEL